MGSPVISWEEWEKSSKNVEDVIAFVNSVLEEKLGNIYDLYFGIVPSEDGIEICFFTEINREKEVNKNMELRIKKDGTILLLGKEIGKAPHNLEKVLKVFLTVAGKEIVSKDVVFDGAQEIDEIGLDIYIK